MNSSGSYLKLEEALDEVRKMRVHTSNDVRNVKFKAQGLFTLREFQVIFEKLKS